jgi:outer membrane protein OmpA-like peptidoglycan-associated protein
MQRSLIAKVALVSSALCLNSAVPAQTPGSDSAARAPIPRSELPVSGREVHLACSDVSQWHTERGLDSLFFIDSVAAETGSHVTGADVAVRRGDPAVAAVVTRVTELLKARTIAGEEAVKSAKPLCSLQLPQNKDEYLDPAWEPWKLVVPSRKTIHDLAKDYDTNFRDRRGSRDPLVLTQSSLHFQQSDSVLDTGFTNTLYLARIADYLRRNPDVIVSAAGYADSSGTDATNQRVSKLRAEAIAKELVRRGIPASRIATVGYGERFATQRSDAPPALRKADRKVELTFVGPEKPSAAADVPASSARGDLVSAIANGITDFVIEQARFELEAYALRIALDNLCFKSQIVRPYVATTCNMIASRDTAKRSGDAAYMPSLALLRASLIRDLSSIPAALITRACSSGGKLADSTQVQLVVASYVWGVGSSVLRGDDPWVAFTSTPEIPCDPGINLVGNSVRAAKSIARAGLDSASWVQAVRITRPIELAAQSFANSDYASGGQAAIALLPLLPLDAKSNRLVANAVGVATDIAEARDDKAVRNALRRYTNPEGGLGRKHDRSAGPYRSIGAYAGGAVSRELLVNANTAKSGSLVSLHFPVVYERGWPAWNVRALVQVLDLGSVASVRMTNSSETDSPEDIKLSQIIAPGVGIALGLWNSPLAIGALASYNPRSRVEERPTGPKTLDAYRLSAFIGVDVPFFVF